MTNEEKKQIASLIADIVWMARRYADGRMTYAPSMFNDAYDQLRDLLGDDIELKADDLTIKNFPYATDEQFGIGNNRKYLRKIGNPDLSD